MLALLSVYQFYLTYLTVLAWQTDQDIIPTYELLRCLAMDRHDKEKEMASILLSSLSMEQNNSLNELPVVTYGCVAE